MPTIDFLWKYEEICFLLCYIILIMTGRTEIKLLLFALDHDLFFSKRRWRLVKKFNAFRREKLICYWITLSKTENAKKSLSSVSNLVFSYKRVARCKLLTDFILCATLVTCSWYANLIAFLAQHCPIYIPYVEATQSENWTN